VEEQRRREAEEAHNLRAAQDMSRLSLGSQASSSSVPPPPPPHYPPPAYLVRALASCHLADPPLGEGQRHALVWEAGTAEWV
jgi:hypothetical protein